MLFVSFFFSGIQWLCFVAFYSAIENRKWVTAFFVLLFSAFLSLASMSTAVLCAWPLLFVVCCFCHHFKVAGRPFLAISAPATLLPTAIFLAAQTPDALERLAAQREHPFVPISAKLEYETAANVAAMEPVGESTDQWIGQFEIRLDRDSSQRYYSRSASLNYLHESLVTEFVNADEFGFRRVRSMFFDWRRKEIAEPPAVLQPSEPTPFSDGTPEDGGPAPKLKEQAKPPSEPELTALHYDGMVDFFDQERYGLVRGEKMAGFLSHRFRQVPQLRLEQPRAAWRVRRLELVSLLKHREPVVYVSEYLPKMDELDDAKVRPVDAFEKASLDRLAAGENLVAYTGLNQIRMVGSIRAARQCLQCHQVQRGRLLGAFTYRLERVTPIQADGSSL